MTRWILILTLVGAQAGIGVVDALNHEWRTSALGFMFAAANTLIFWPR